MQQMAQALTSMLEREAATPVVPARDAVITVGPTTAPEVDARLVQLEAQLTQVGTRLVQLANLVETRLPAPVHVSS
jgi:hypothetical protein